MRTVPSPGMLVDLQKWTRIFRSQPPRPKLVVAGVACALPTLALTTDAMIRDRAPFDRGLISVVQQFDAPLLGVAVEIVGAATDSFWAPRIWGVVLATLILARWRLPAIALLTLPAGGVVNHAIGIYLVDRTRPDETEIARTIGDWNAPSFPSGHVMGAVMLYGFLIFLSPRIAPPALRLVARAASILVIATVGFARLWVGAHWPSDVLAAYAFGGLWLVLLIACFEQFERAVADCGSRGGPAFASAIAREPTAVGRSRVEDGRPGRFSDKVRQAGSGKLRLPLRWGLVSGQRRRPMDAMVAGTAASAETEPQVP